MQHVSIIMGHPVWAACYKQWTTEWQQLPTCRMTKIFFPKPDKNKTKKLLKHGRAYLHRLIECATGHNNLNYLQSKIYPEDVSELCRFCEEEPETFDHLLNECPCFQQARFDILQNQPIQNTLNWNSELGGTPLPLISGTCTQSTVGMPLCLS